MSERKTNRGLVAREVVFGVKGSLINLHLMQLPQSHFLVIVGAGATTFGKISNALRLTCPRQRCYTIRFSASCRDSYKVVLSASRQLSLSISVYLVEPTARSAT